MNLMKLNNIQLISAVTSISRGCELRAALHDLGMWVGEKLDMKSAACPFKSESLLYAGLHKKQCGQQGEGEDSVPLLCSWETPRAVLHPAFGLPAGKDKDLLKEHNEDDEWPEEPPL